MSSQEEKVSIDESENGFVFNDEHYIPEEILINILSNVDHKTLLSCQSVCKQWNSLMKSCVWRKKAELMINHALPYDPDATWKTHYLICHKKPFYRNLIKNHSGQQIFKRPGHVSGDRRARLRLVGRLHRDQIRENLRENKFQEHHNWLVTRNGGSCWAVEKPPIGAPALPDDPIFEGINCCFVTSYGYCLKEQVIDLVQEGISEFLLDNLQPTIKVSEWFSSRWDCGSVYKCKVHLITGAEGDHAILSQFNYSKEMRNGDQNQWFKFEHEFKNYGKGLRKIIFEHEGSDVQTWDGHYGSKMAGASVILTVPNETTKQTSIEQDEPLLIRADDSTQHPQCSRSQKRIETDTDDSDDGSGCSGSIASTSGRLLNKAKILPARGRRFLPKNIFKKR